MENNSLRIGNYVWENYGGIYIVREIREKELIISKTKTTISVGYKYSEINGIRLEEELFLRLGAKKSLNVIFISVPNLKAELHFEIFEKEIVTTLRSDFCELILYPIAFVHQLQNLFFVLSNGRELSLTDALPSQKQ